MMRRDEKRSRLRGYSRRLLPLSEAAEARDEHEVLERVPGVGAAGTDEELGRKARVLRKLARDEELDPTEEFYAEAIIFPEQRPVVLIQEGSFDALPAPWTHFATDPAIRTIIETAIPSVGRIESAQFQTVSHLGTAFLVGPELLMTNRHVASLFAEGLGLRNLRFAPGRTARVDFLAEQGSDEAIEFDLRRIAMIHPYWDMALLEVEGLSGQQPLALSVTHPDDLRDRDVAVIGYPARDRRNDLQVQDEVFHRVYNVKRLQPGKVMGRRETRSYPGMVQALAHDSSTLGGNSGSVVLDVATGQVAALHFAGRYLDANFAVPSWELARDDRVRSQGVSFAAPLVGAGEIGWEDHWRRADLGSEAVRPVALGGSAGGGSAGGASAARASSAPRPSDGPGGPEAGTTFTVPIEITFRVGRPQGAPGVTGAGLPAIQVEAEEAIRPDPDYANRAGYDPDFLGADRRISLPALAEDLLPLVAINQKPTGEPHVLPYHHFSIVMNRRRGIAFFTGANIDGRRHVSVKREKDRWFPDPRIEDGEQLQNDVYADTESEENPLDRGHLVRRLDPTWGSAAQAKAANDDTFHWTNCSPQHKGFNRNKTTWGGVENFILGKARDADRRVTVFTGPIFRETDWDLTLENGARVVLPDEYWKVIAFVKDDGTLSATGYVISQKRELDDWLEATFSARTFQRPIRWIERETGLSFHQLAASDPLDTPQETLTEVAREITSFGDIVL